MEREPGVRKGAFFDLERTITANAVEQIASLAMWRRGDVSNGQVLRVLWCSLRYNLGLISEFEQLKAPGSARLRRPVDAQAGRHVGLLPQDVRLTLDSSTRPPCG